MFADIEWSNVHLAGAFLLGAIFGTFSAIRIMRAVLLAFRGENRRTWRRDAKEPDSTPSGEDVEPGSD